jgi:hypothetical protein
MPKAILAKGTLYHVISSLPVATLAAITEISSSSHRHLIATAEIYRRVIATAKSTRDCTYTRDCTLHLLIMFTRVKRRAARSA